MTSPDFQRARNPDQKARRRAEILQCTKEMLEEEGLEGLTLNGIARRVGLAKSNIYRYFESREAILLHLFQEEICEWVDDLVKRLRHLRSQSRLEKLASHLAVATASRSTLCLFSSIVGSVLEKNASVETVRAFKLANLREIQRLVGAMAQAVPELQPEQHGELLQMFGKLVAGFWPDAHPPAVVQEALEDPALEGFRRDFEASLERGALILARGIAAKTI